MAESSPQPGVTVVGATRHRLRDGYHLFLRARWPVAITFIVVTYLGINAVFALAYLAFGGVVNTRTHSFWDVGTDDTSLQPVHARRRYADQEILWGARHADVLGEDSAGNLVLDVRKLHEV